LVFLQTKRIIHVVAIDANNLPDNPELLRQMVVDLTAQLDEHERRYQRVQNILEQLLRWRFGQKREKFDERQMLLFSVQWEAEGRTAQELAEELGLDEDDPLAPEEESEAKPARRRGHGRKPLPRSLTRERIEHELPESERQCPRCALSVWSTCRPR